ncbi:uncharacterized protein [Aegilops tauschii subsp. strangulata]|uniref:uncharacterized protein n=1 Tax=Aegilops tauschii subsp. strangulata TaxID=200361 RepID=UPI001ABC570B|nr:uncharacterized protein LOC120963209 [Aegilops tauschii subsp. strangulata]
MAVPYYAYLKMKMSVPKGLITITGDYRKSLECARDGTKLAESLVIAEEQRQLDRIVALAGEASAASIPIPDPADESSGQVERANGLILSGVKPRLVEPLIRSPGSWLDELPAVL